MKNTQKTQAIEPSTMFNLRVLLRYDEKYEIHVAHCFETGSLVTADTSEEAKDMIRELLEDEIDFALKTRNVKNLFSTPASLDVLIQWMEAAKTNIETVSLDIKLKETNLNEVRLRSIEYPNSNITSKVAFAKAA
jgi:hypothetical protein